jgi:hypothetical protein
LREEHLCLAWERQLIVPERLVTSSGDVLQVVFPGRRCGDAGPDFRDAVLAQRDSTLLRGDVEVHLDVAGWVGHGHAANPAYDRVIVHLTWSDLGPVYTSAGRGVVALALLPCLAMSPEALVQMPVRRQPPVGASCPAALAADDLAAAPDFLHAQGRARLEAHSALLAADAAVVGYDQAIWTALLRGLGYQRNTAAFQHLAKVVTWPIAAGQTGSLSARDDLVALLLGAAGLLEAPERGLPATDEAARRRYLDRWHRLQPCCADEPLRYSAWTATGVRPDNAPPRRMAAAAGLARAYRTGLSAALCRNVALLDQPLHLEAGADPFWASRADFGRRVGPEPIRLLGTARERELLVNAVLPGVLAMAHDSADTALEKAVDRRYERLGAAAPNQITRHMRRTIGVPSSLSATVAAEQGLLHLYHTWCRERRCWECPLPEAFSAARPRPGVTSSVS